MLYSNQTFDTEMPSELSQAPSEFNAVKKHLRYKAKIDHVFPQKRRNSFEKESQCFLGISLENSNFTTGKLTGIVEWISRRFSRCTVLIGDSIHRITLESVGKLSGKEALDAALLLGEEFIQQQGAVFQHFAKATKFVFVTCGSIQKTPEYVTYLETLRQLFEQDAAFRMSIEAFGSNYHRKHSVGISLEALKNRVALSAQYFLEEFAIFSCLQQQGLGVMIYPGSFSTLAEIASDVHPAAPKELKMLTVVSLCLKGTR